MALAPVHPMWHSRALQRPPAAAGGRGQLPPGCPAAARQPCRAAGIGRARPAPPCSLGWLRSTLGCSSPTRRPAAAAGAGAGAGAAEEPQVGFIGAGQMAEALARGLAASGLPSGNLHAWNRRDERCAIFEEFGAAVEGSNSDVVDASDVVLLAVKPHQVATALGECGSLLGPDKLLVSVVAGLPCSTLEALLPDGARVARVMPNTPSLIRRAASAFCLGSVATESDAALVERLMSSVGVAVRVEEYQMDAVTGLSGSGPAYVFAAIEAMADGGVAAGLPRAVALRLAAQTVAGAAEMVLQGGATEGECAHPGVLKDKVASPAGTTIRGLRALEERGMRSAFIEAVVAASERSKELGK